MAQISIDFEPISKEDVLRLYESGKSCKWVIFFDEFLASRKPAIALNRGETIKGSLRTSINRRYSNIYAFGRCNKSFFVNTELMPEFADVKKAKIQRKSRK